MKLTNYAQAEDKHAFAQAFSLLPSHLRGGRYRSALLPAQLERGLVEMQLPAPCNFWLLEEDGNPIGRIGANVSCRSAQTGYVGFFEVDTRRAGAGEAAQKLIETACGFLQGKAASVFGPVNLNTWLPYRLRVDERDRALLWVGAGQPTGLRGALSGGGIQAQDRLPFDRFRKPRTVSGTD